MGTGLELGQKNMLLVEIFNVLMYSSRLALYKDFLFV